MTLCCVHGVSVTWWVTHLVTGVNWYCSTLGCIHGLLINTVTMHSSYHCLASAITIIVQWIHCIVAVPELPLLPVTWACNLTASPLSCHYCKEWHSHSFKGTEHGAWKFFIACSTVIASFHGNSMGYHGNMKILLPWVITET